MSFEPLIHSCICILFIDLVSFEIKSCILKLCYRFVLLEDCNHVIESTVLDEQVAAATKGVDRLLECPQCSKPIVKTMRYRNSYIRFRKQMNVINKTVDEEVSLMKEICSTHVNLFRSEPTTSCK